MVLVFIEVREGKVKKSSLEALSEGKRRADDLGTELHAVLIGHELDELAPECFSFGATKVHVLENTLLSQYSPSGFSRALKELVEELKPTVLFFAASSMGKDLAPRLAAWLNVGLATDCTETGIKDGLLTVVRPIFAGNAFATMVFKASPQIATLRPNVFPLVDSVDAKGEAAKKDVEITEGQVKDEVKEIMREEGSELDVTEAEILISGGRGLKGPENFDLLRELASILPRSAVGASRSAVDSGWIDHQNQVGQTGKTVSPNLYMAFGISGAIQHVAGMSSSKVIVAVNKDPDAPILKLADFGVVGDLFKVIPPLKEELKKILAD
jgi:electron transfer flavoprotein alpha subunit